MLGIFTLLIQNRMNTDQIHLRHSSDSYQKLSLKFFLSPSFSSIIQFHLEIFCIITVFYVIRQFFQKPFYSQSKKKLINK